MIKLARPCGCPPDNDPSCKPPEPPEPPVEKVSSHDICEPCGGILKRDECEKPRVPIVVSEIVKSGQPYKEIEAILNENRVVLRMQKEPPASEFTPPCECKDPESQLGVSFRKVDTSTPNRTISLYPTPEVEKPPPVVEESDQKKEKKEKISQAAKTTCIEENPNIFVLRIKRKSDNSSEKHSLDLEFRTPRPWRLNKCEKEKDKGSDTRK